MMKKLYLLVIKAVMKKMWAKRKKSSNWWWHAWKDINKVSSDSFDNIDFCPTQILSRLEQQKSEFITLGKSFASKIIF